MQPKEKRSILFLPGMPGEGKTTYIAGHADELKQYTIISMDELIVKRQAEIKSTTGRDVNVDTIMETERPLILERFREAAQKAIDQGDNIVLDKPMPKKQERKLYVDMARASPKYEYSCVAIQTHPPEEMEHVARLLNRSIKEGRFFPMNFLSIARPEPLETGEFDGIHEVGKPPLHGVFHEYREEPFDIMQSKKDPRDPTKWHR